jgi:uncharacterized protein (TIGR00255 family)
MGVQTPLSGMTGFGRAAGEDDFGQWAWEARSVNNRGLDMRVSMPSGFEALDSLVKDKIKARFTRGSIQVGLSLRTVDAEGALRVSTRELSRLSRRSRQWVKAGLAPLRFDTALSMRGVLVSQPKSALADDDAVIAILAGGLDAALAALEQSRREEGAALFAILMRHFDALDRQRLMAETEAAGQPDLIRARLEKRVAELVGTGAPEPDRIAQEILLLATKADVREELDRLQAHIGSGRALLEAGQAVGRKLDFLTQELNREANTLCSKSQVLALTDAGLAMKTLIDQVREQVQNVE